MANTPNRNWPLPALSGTLKNNGELLIAILGLIDGDMQAAINAASGKAGLVSPAFSGNPTAPTPVSGDDSNKLATTAFVKAATALAIANLVGASPATLDTLNELATALGNDPNFATTVATQIGLKANLTDITDMVTKTAAQTLTNKTLTTPVLKLKNSAGAAPTDLGEVQWDSTTERLKVGNGSTTKEHAANTWELIEDIDVSGVSLYSKTNLAAYKKLRVQFNFDPDSAPGAFYAQVSTDNGATWVATNSYYRQELYGSSSAGTTTETNTYWALTSTNAIIVGSYGVFSQLIFDRFNKAKILKGFLDGNYQVHSTGQLVVNRALLGLSSTVARNAFRITAGANFSGNIRVEGVRG